MIVLTNSAAQTLAVGQSVVFDTELLRTGCTECHRKNTSSVKMRSCGVYDVSFSGNVSGTAVGSVQLTLEVGGEPLPETTMITTLAATTDIFNVATSTAVRNCCGDYDRITVTNTGTEPIVVEANSCIKVGKKCN